MVPKVARIQLSGLPTLSPSSCLRIQVRFGDGAQRDLGDRCTNLSQEFSDLVLGGTITSFPNVSVSYDPVLIDEVLGRPCAISACLPGGK